MGYKILVINWRDIKNPNVGGAEVHFQEIFKRLVARGHEVTLLCSRHDRTFPEEEWIDGIRIVRRGNRFAFNFAVPRAYKREFERSDIDIVVEDSNKVPFYTPLYVRKPLFIQIHHLHGRSIYGDAFLPAAMYVHLMERLIGVFDRGAQFVAVSESSKAELVSMGLRPEDIEVIHNGLDHSLYTPDESVRSKAPLVACVTRLKRYKGVHLLLQAMTQVKIAVPDVRLLVAGSGDYAPALHTLARKLDLGDSVEFTGFITDEEKAELYRRAHVSVNPSSKEGWGLNVIEANACGTPVVAADVPGLRDSVVNGETGLLYPHADIEAQAKAIITLLKDERLRKTMSAKGIEWAGQFTWDKAADQTEAVIERVVHNHSLRS
ncbi:MAG: glycosyltransferase family 4 protein [Candidatus Abyssubacteria bacterium]